MSNINFRTLDADQAAAFASQPHAKRAILPASDIEDVILGIHESTGEPFVLVTYGYRSGAVLMACEKLIEIAA